MRRVWYIILLLAMLGSCRKAGTEQREMVAKLTGQEIEFPEGLTYQIQDTPIEYDPRGADYTIVAYVDSGGCIPCNLRLSGWDRLINEFKGREEETRVNFVMILNTRAEENGYALKRDNFFHPVSFDPEGLFSKTNSLGCDPNSHCLLLDGEGKTAVVGNPVVNPKIRELYRRVIDPEGKSREDTGLCRYPTASIGAVRPGESVEREFILNNDGARALTVEEIVTSCYCTTATIDSDTLRPGAMSILTVRYTADSIIGPVTGYVDVFYKEQENPERITLHGYVTQNNKFNH